MAFGKLKQTQYNVEAYYHTITGVNIDLSAYPESVLDENGDPTGELKGGSTSYVLVASYKDEQSYLKRCVPLEYKNYSFDFQTTVAVVNSTEKSCKQAAYDLLVIAEPFFADADIV